jgi:Leucine-rich repeat (LRR) protein
VEIIDSLVDCVDLQDLARFYKLKHLQVTNSKLKQMICPAKPARYKTVINNLEGIQTLDVSYNYLSHLDSRLQSSTQLEHLNVAHNQLYQLSAVMSTFAKLKSLDISSIHLSENLDRKIFENISLTLQHLDLTGKYTHS